MADSSSQSDSDWISPRRPSVDDEGNENDVQEPMMAFEDPVDDGNMSTTGTSDSENYDGEVEDLGMEDECVSVHSPSPTEDPFRDENVPIVVRPPIELASNTRLKIKLEKVHVTAEWKWTEGGDDSCGICQQPFEACCVECRCPGDECPLVLGFCRHPFHMHCIVKWTDAQNTQKPLCPLCRQEWKYAS